MKLWMSAELQSDVDDAYRDVRKPIEATINKELESVSLTEKADKWAFIAIILKGDDPDYGEIVKRSSQGKVLEFRLRIPHEEFACASNLQRQDMVFNSLSSAVDQMGKLKVPLESREKLMSILLRAQHELLKRA